MDDRVREGKALIADIYGQAALIVRGGRAPDRVMIGRLDLMKVWIALGDELWGFKPDEAIQVRTRDWYVWLTFEIMEELPEGVVVVA